MTIDSSQFIYIAKSKTFVAEASQLPGVSGWLENKIALRSERTGRVVQFTYFKTDTDDRENEVTAWRFEATVDGNRFEMVVFND